MMTYFMAVNHRDWNIVIEPAQHEIYGDPKRYFWIHALSRTVSLISQKSDKLFIDELYLLSWHEAILVRLDEVTIANSQNLW